MKFMFVNIYMNEITIYIYVSLSHTKILINYIESAFY